MQDNEELVKNAFCDGFEIFPEIVVVKALIPMPRETVLDIFVPEALTLDEHKLMMFIDSLQQEDKRLTEVSLCDNGNFFFFLFLSDKDQSCHVWPN
jgi:hypothetical protein